MTTETLFKKSTAGYTEFRGTRKPQIFISHPSFLSGDCSKSMFLVSFLKVCKIRWNKFNNTMVSSMWL